MEPGLKQLLLDYRNRKRFVILSGLIASRICSWERVGAAERPVGNLNELALLSRPGITRSRGQWSMPSLSTVLTNVDSEKLERVMDSFSRWGDLQANLDR